ncbi:MAG: hypothetical protein AAF705_11320, partial [Bacteroidota bacterium]
MVHITNAPYWSKLLLFVLFLTPFVSTYGQAENEAKRVENGKFVFNGRLRNWYANQEGLKGSNAATFGTNFGYLTKSYKGFQIYIEGESVVAIT